MADPAVIYATGKEPVIGFPTDPLANASRDEEVNTPTADVEEVEGEAGTVDAVVTSDPGVEISANGTALSGFTPPEIGAALTLGGVAGYATEGRVSRTPTLCRFTVAIKKEDSVTVS